MNINFIDFDVNNYVKEFTVLLRDGKRKFLIRGLTDEAYAFIAIINGLKKDFNFTLYGYDVHGTFDRFGGMLEPCEPTIKDGYPDWADVGIDVALIFTYSSVGKALMEFTGTPCCIVAPYDREYAQNRTLYFISIPKSGSHLLAKLLQLFRIPWRGINPLGHSARPNTLCTEVMPSEEVDSFVNNPGLFLYRDPRDTIVSLTHHWMDDRFMDYPLFKWYLQSLPTHDERLLQMILGCRPIMAWDGVRDYYLQFAGWFYFKNVTSLRFEDLVGLQGGGSYEAQIETIWRLQLILRVAGAPEQFAKDVFDTSAKTFRRGQIGSYRDEFTQEHHKAFDSLDQDFMRLYGYN